MKTPSSFIPPCKICIHILMHDHFFFFGRGGRGWEGDKFLSSGAHSLAPHKFKNLQGILFTPGPLHLFVNAPNQKKMSFPLSFSLELLLKFWKEFKSWPLLSLNAIEQNGLGIILQNTGNNAFEVAIYNLHVNKTEVTTLVLNHDLFFLEKIIQWMGNRG